MMKTLPLVLGLLFGAGACKKSESTATQAQGSGQGGTAANGESVAGGGSGGTAVGRSRTGKIDWKPIRKGQMTKDGEVAAEDAGRRAEQRADRMKAMDTDGDGTVSDAEREAFRKDRQAEMMARLDTNGDGTVSEEERTAAMKDRAENMRERLDTDGDGKLTVAEMEASRFKQMDPATMDKDHDGIISAEELQAGMPARRPRFGGPDTMGPGGAGSPDGKGPAGMAPTK